VRPAARRRRAARADRRAQSVEPTRSHSEALAAHCAARSGRPSAIQVRDALQREHRRPPIRSRMRDTWRQ
jgi:hypothetical protein